jgi:hypothetical protein
VWASATSTLAPPAKSSSQHGAPMMVVETDRPRHARFSFVAFTAVGPTAEYALALARNNMLPYLSKQGQEFDEARWRTIAAVAELFCISDDEEFAGEKVGFLSIKPHSTCLGALP